MSVATYGTINAPNGLVINGPSVSVPNSFAAFTATTSSSTGGSVNNFAITAGIPWLISGTNGVLQLAKGNYIVQIFCPSTLGQAAGAGAYCSIGWSQGGAGVVANQYNLNGYVANAATNVNCMTPMVSDGTSATNITAYVALGATSFANSTQTHNVRIIKIS